jgi:hypothetical protein
MNRKHAKAAAWLMATVIGASCFSPSAFADEASVKQDISYVPDEIVYTTENAPDSDELFAQYVERTFGIEEAVTDEQEAGSYILMASGKTALSGINRIVYDRLSDGAAQIASGNMESTIFTFTADDLGIGGSYSADDLGVSYIVEGNSINPEASNAMYSKLNLDYGLVIDSLLFDTPYELYWYDKTVGIRLQPPGIYGHYTDGEWKLSYKGEYTIKMAVSADYRGSYSVTDYKVDKALTSAASSAALAAEAVVEANKTKLDYDKLVAYRDYICDAVSFHSSASNSNQQYGDPWQLIYVFDNNPDTNVVCEGYSKAFQYLCSKSVWHDPGFSCISVDGNMVGGTGAGRHMWNIVKLDGVNYLVDVTNSDSGTAGHDGSLFLKGYYEGSFEDGYSFTYGGGSTISFVYDDEARRVFDSGDLTLSNTDLIPETHNEKYGHSWEGDTSPVTVSCTESFERTMQCSICNLSRTETFPAEGHRLEHMDAVDPTCGEAGNSEYWTCTVCGKYFSDAEGSVEIEEGSWVIPAKSHDWEFVGFTWTQDGDNYRATADYVCRNDGEHRQSLEAEVQKIEDRDRKLYKASVGVGNELDGLLHEDEKVVNEEHVHELTKVEAVAATCEEEGSSEYWHCAGCGKYFSDEAGNTEIQENSWVIPATGHDWDEGTVTKTAVCSSPGVRKFTCKNDPSHTYTESIPELGHEWTTVIFRQPTCTKPGRSISVCKRNRRHVVTNVVPATGHDWDEGVVTKEPTETSTGVMTYTCKNNRYHTHTEVIPTTGTASGAGTGTGTSSGTGTGTGSGTGAAGSPNPTNQAKNGGSTICPLIVHFRNVWRRWAGYMCEAR